jgi:uncharacterized protein (DUF427 family)
MQPAQLALQGATTTRAREYLKRSITASTCPWKGRTEYFDIVVGSQVNEDAAWSVPAPKPEARNIARYVAFWRGVEVEA